MTFGEGQVIKRILEHLKGREMLLLSQSAQAEQGPFYSLPDANSRGSRDFPELLGI